MPGWEEATAVQKVSSNTYTATLHDDWCIGSGKFPSNSVTIDISASVELSLRTRDELYEVDDHDYLSCALFSSRSVAMTAD
jgi:hypothetical protein